MKKYYRVGYNILIEKEKEEFSIYTFKSDSFSFTTELDERYLNFLEELPYYGFSRIFDRKLEKYDKRK